MALDTLHKIVIDTDCGIDDAVALLLALGSKDVAEVLAITCCFGNTSVNNACSNVMRVLTVCNEKDIPIHKGCAGPIITRSCAKTVHGEDGLGNCSHKFSTGGIEENEVPASLALINIAKKYPHQITVVAIGPLTNLATAERLDPTFTENLKSIIIMGGNYKGVGNVTEVAEFNFYSDPEAANIIVSEAKCPITLVPWETTMEYGIQWELYKELLEMETTRALFFKSISRLHAIEHEQVYKAYIDCDFLAAAAALYPECVKMVENYFLVVECEGKHSTGLTILKQNLPKASTMKRVQIVTAFDYEILTKLRKKMLT